MASGALLKLVSQQANFCLYGISREGEIYTPDLGLQHIVFWYEVIRDVCQAELIQENLISYI